jgi:hypothetical protein
MFARDFILLLINPITSQISDSGHEINIEMITKFSGEINATNLEINFLMEPHTNIVITFLMKQRSVIFPVILC